MTRLETWSVLGSVLKERSLGYRGKGSLLSVMMTLEDCSALLIDQGSTRLCL